MASFEGDGKPHLFIFELIVGGQTHRPDLGETGVFMGRPGQDFTLVCPTRVVRLTDEDWLSFGARQRMVDGSEQRPAPHGRRRGSQVLAASSRLGS